MFLALTVSTKLCALRFWENVWKNVLMRPLGFEPRASTLSEWRSTWLSYGRPCLSVETILSESSAFDITSLVIVGCCSSIQCILPRDLTITTLSSFLAFSSSCSRVVNASDAFAVMVEAYGAIRTLGIAHTKGVLWPI